VGRDPDAVAVGLFDRRLEHGGVHLGELSEDVIHPDLEEVRLVGGCLTHVRDRFVGGLGPIDLIGCARNRRRPAGNADTTPGREQRCTRKCTAALLIAQFVHQVAIESQREYGSDAVALVLQQLRLHVLARIGVGAALAASDETYVPVHVDDAGHDGAAADFHDPRSCRDFQLGSIAHRRDPVAVDDQRRVLPRRPSGSIDQGGAAQDDHFAEGCLGSDDRERDGEHRSHDRPPSLAGHPGRTVSVIDLENVEREHAATASSTFTLMVSRQLQVAVL